MMRPSTVVRSLPHPGEDAHLLLIAVPVDNDVVGDPSCHRDVVDEVALQVGRLLARTVAQRPLEGMTPDEGGCEVCGAESLAGGRWCLDHLRRSTPRPGGIGVRHLVAS